MILSGTYSKNDEKVHLKSSSQAGQNINTSQDKRLRVSDQRRL